MLIDESGLGIPEIQHTSAGYVIGPGTMVMLVIAIVFVMPIAKWALGELYALLKEQLMARKKGDGGEDVSAPSINQLVQKLADETRAGFTSLRDLISGHNSQLTGLARDVGHLDDAQKRAEARMDRIEQQIATLGAELRREIAEALRK